MSDDVVEILVVEDNQFTESIRTLGMYWLLLNKPPTIG